MAHELVFPREGCAAGALPVTVSTVFLVCPEVGQHGEVLPVALFAHVHFWTVASLVVVLCANHGLERLELGVPLVPPAPFLGTRVLLLLLVHHQLVYSIEVDGLGESDGGLILISVGPHVHPQVGISLESFPADLAIVSVLGQYFCHIQLDNVVVINNSTRRFAMIPFITTYSWQRRWYTSLVL